MNQVVSVLMASMKTSMAGVCQLRSVHVNMVALLMEEVNKSRRNVRSGKNDSFSLQILCFTEVHSHIKISV